MGESGQRRFHGGDERIPAEHGAHGRLIHSEAVGRRFESCRGRQLVGRKIGDGPYNRRGATSGAIPTRIRPPISPRRWFWLPRSRGVCCQHEIEPVELMKRIVSRSAQDFIAAWWRGDAGPVPCGACSACCHYAGIPVDRKRDRQRLPHLLTERNRDGDLVLRQRPDGACIHLDRYGCTVYEHRPAVCRTFDCRVFAAMGIVEHCAPGHRTPSWQFAGN